MDFTVAGVVGVEDAEYVSERFRDNESGGAYLSITWTTPLAMSTSGRMTRASFT